MKTTSGNTRKGDSAATTPNIWLLGMRPRTLTMAAAPVAVGAALAWGEGVTPDWLTFVVTLACAVLIQIGTNLFNDARDGERGADGPDRIGPVRITGAGLAQPRQVRRAALACFFAALVAGIYLVFVGGIPILAIGLASLVAGYAYSSGPRPLSHGPFSETYVIVFFGLIAVAGSYYLQAKVLPGTGVLLTGIAIGSYAAAVLLVNNLRDTAADLKAGRRTLAGRLGTRGSRWLYGFLLLAPFPLLAAAWGVRPLGYVWLALPVCLWAIVLFARMPVGPGMNAQLGRTAMIQVLVGVLLIVEKLT
ncbi:1,4-dihydroxy-2-naphthoate octaprenyltransferase [Lentisalinibacter sediminis]|uniref:1,4-dihydroxy-2-naphthoate octaprenyltransferase n=1 Tax=Lentisalinibacter sediminis TaxID=2992237 RepID=UPI0038708999